MFGWGWVRWIPPRSASPSLVAGEESKFVDVFDQIDHTSYTLLHHAAVHGHVKVAQYLLGHFPDSGHPLLHGDKGSDKTQGQGQGQDQDPDKSTALSTTIIGKTSCDKNQKTLHGHTPLILAVDHMLPKSHIQADRSLAMEAADQGRLKVFQALVKAGANLEYRDGKPEERNGRTPLIVAASHGLVDVMKDAMFGKKQKNEDSAFLACLHDITDHPNQQTGRYQDQQQDLFNFMFRKPTFLSVITLLSLPSPSWTLITTYPIV